MSRQRYQRAVLVRRFPVSFLSDLVYGTQAMPLELAETIRTLRREHGLQYENVRWSLCQSDPDAGQCFGFGRALVELACRRLDDHDPSWK
jgi:hypothetical protein